LHFAPFFIALLNVSDCKTYKAALRSSQGNPVKQLGLCSEGSGQKNNAIKRCKRLMALS
jgi:hypothetical protein